MTWLAVSDSPSALDPQEKGRVSKQINAARKEMLEAVRDAGRVAAAEAAGAAADDAFSEMEFAAVLMERESGFVTMCRGAAGAPAS